MHSRVAAKQSGETVTVETEASAMEMELPVGRQGEGGGSFRIWWYITTLRIRRKELVQICITDMYDLGDNYVDDE